MNNEEADARTTQTLDPACRIHDECLRTVDKLVLVEVATEKSPEKIIRTLRQMVLGCDSGLKLKHDQGNRT